MHCHNALPHLVAYNSAIIDQALEVLDAYQAHDETLFAGQCGPQIRHLIEHLDALLTGAAVGSVDYDDRKRDGRLEQSIALCRERLRFQQSGLLELGRTAAGDHCLTVTFRTGFGGAVVSSSTSSLARELQFLASHAVHHFALIRVHALEDGIDLGPDFGKAPSTIQFEQAQGLIKGAA